MMKKRFLSLAMAFILVLSLFAGCSGNPQPSQGGGEDAQTTQSGGENPSGPQTQDQDKPEETPPAERTVTVTDMSGDEVTVTGEVKKIVNLWPSASSSFIVMGAGDLLCGLGADTANAWSRFFYPNLDNIPVLGGIEPSVEDIVKLDPDLVIVHPSSGRSGYAQQLRELDIPAININFSNYETMVQAYTMLGTVLGGEYQEKLATWCAAMEEKASSHRSLTGALTEKPTVD